MLFQYKMVKEALSERANLLEIAPHLAYKLPIMLPIYKYGSGIIHNSRFYNLVEQTLF